MFKIYRLGLTELKSPHQNPWNSFLMARETHQPILANLRARNPTLTLTVPTRPELPHSLEYLCLPPGGQVQLVPLSQAMGKGQAVDAEHESSLKTTESPSMERG